ncbi:MAG: hypothetical protein HQK49_08780 [Oligoflexia bacterium]|nr:hypothetical protein [Oligoflexia bacterium]
MAANEQQKKKLSIKKIFIFSSLTIFLSLTAIFSALLILDLSIHKKLENQGGLNYRGYRGTVVSSKKKDEFRVAFFGECITFGYGVHWNEAYPAVIEKFMRMVYPNTTAVNLGANSHGIYGIYHDVDYYDYLDYDVAFIFDGNVGVSKSDFRGEDAFFLLFGYKTILQTYLSEKAMILKYGVSNLENAYLGKIDSNIAKKERPIQFMLGMVASEMEVIIKAANKKLLSMLSMSEKQEFMSKKDKTASDEFIYYVDKIFEKLLSKNKIVYYLCKSGDYNSKQQTLVRELIRRKYSNKVKYIDLSPILDLQNVNIAFDGLHLTKYGQETLSKGLLEEIRKLKGDGKI